MYALKALLVGLAFYLSASSAMAELYAGRSLERMDIELLDGKSLTANQLAGKPTAYLFWATWCHICRSELPGYQKLYAKFHTRGFRVIAVSLDNSASEVRKFWKTAGYTFPVAMRTNAIRSAFGDIRGTPTLFLIDREGRMVEKRLGEIDPDELEAMIQGLL